MNDNINNLRKSKGLKILKTFDDIINDIIYCLYEKDLFDIMNFRETFEIARQISLNMALLNFSYLECKFKDIFNGTLCKLDEIIFKEKSDEVFLFIWSNVYHKERHYHEKNYFRMKCSKNLAERFSFKACKVCNP